MNRVLATGVVVAALVFAGTQAMGREHLRCESEVADRLAELNVAETDIAGTLRAHNSDCPASAKISMG